jgi:XTP/dITP diphosphohydrolase
VLDRPQGEHGFGYDPHFWVPTHQCSAAQLPKAVKNQISHRAQATAALLLDLQQRLGLKLAQAV